jgi:SpoVK/Ycf46/Vps4 family AAA+-type ATPase
LLIDSMAQAIMGQMDPQKDKRKGAKTKSKEALGKLGLDLSTLDLNEHEEQIASEVVAAEDINVTFKGEQPLGLLSSVSCTLPLTRDTAHTDVGGLDPIISQLREAVIFPLVYPQLFESSAGLFGAPKGVLLYGPPGCGKTMLAKVSSANSPQFLPCRRTLTPLPLLTFTPCGTFRHSRKSREQPSST